MSSSLPLLPLLFGDNSPPFVEIFLSVILVIFLRHVLKGPVRRHDADIDIPHAVGDLPFLGHALAYKADPSSFLLRQHRSVGPVFRVNLAGRRMVIITDPLSASSVVKASEVVMSSREAVINVGFGLTLGRLNVDFGTVWHKRILKEEVFSGERWGEIRATFRAALSGALDDATSDAGGGHPDLLALVRRAVLRASLRTYVFSGAAAEEKILDDMTRFQDELEDATAGGAVLPAFLAGPLFWRPVERRRADLVRQLTPAIEASWAQGGEGSVPGPWARKFRREGIPPENAAELVVGLMFAAHKNAAIAAAQALIYLRTEGTKRANEAAHAEAVLRLASLPGDSGGTGSGGLLGRIARETLRLTAHALGALRVARRDVRVPRLDGGTYVVRAGETIALGHVASHLDPGGRWGSGCAKFDPDRLEWMDPAMLPDDYKFSTFSQGVHRCPGERLGVWIVEETLAMLLVRGVKVVGETPPVSFERATLAQRAGAVAISFEQEKKNNFS